MTRVTVPIVYDAIIDACCGEDETERVEIDSVSVALSSMGYRPVPLPVDLSVDATFFRELSPRFVFNCIDSLEESGRFAHVVPTILDHLDVPYTGSGADAIYLTSNKVLAKRFLGAHGLRTPRWCSVGEAAAEDVPFGPPYIVKHVWEDASFGLDEGSVFTRRRDLAAHASGLPAARREDRFVEEFVDGREFNVSLVAEGGRARALPPLEVEFVGFEGGRPRIVDYKTKWDHDPSTGARIERRFDFPESDRALVRELEEMARRSWELFGLGGYARVDFRVDGGGAPWILEINTNPYLGTDSSFLAAASRAGLGFDDVVRVIVADALGRPARG